MVDVATISALAKLLGDGVAIIIIILLYIHTYKQMEKERQDDKKRYEKMVDDVIAGVHNMHLTPSESKNIVYIEKQINDDLNVILKETGASRVSVIRYHNGNKDMTGKSFLKMSTTNEVINMGVSSMMASFNNVFRSFLAYWCHEIETKGYCSIDNVENIKEKDTSLYQYLKTINVQASHAVALRDADNNVIGVLCIEYLDRDDFNIGKIEKSLDENFSKIETLISVGGGVENEL